MDGVKHKAVKVPKVLSRWKHPPYQVVKINFDGAYDVKEQLSASGIMARDSEGEVLASKSKVHKNVASAFAAEALACQEVIQLGIDMQHRKVIIKGDSLTVREYLNTYASNRNFETERGTLPGGGSANLCRNLEAK
ncbi:reverse transcriptase [Gossypium australe]|uniref:Reverse transcriptase n=1 Tax=Gossypium australe TaxID=47621 RepID=A0A5B6WQL6_9ROSI|nr:reverse transcriptase [Gossypium australe]